MILIFPSDIEIASNANIQHISKIASALGISEENLEYYGKYKAKISNDFLKSIENNKNGKLILVTAINPTPAGEGKTTTTVGLGQAFAKIGKKACVALREPSLGPAFGVKGGAAGGGYAQVIPMEDINLHFTGDFHAVTSANNLLCAVIDNHIHHSNTLNIDPRTITFKRVLDMNDRMLRETVIGLGGKVNGYPREDGFTITVASEVMAILCLAENMEQLKQMLGDIVIGYNYSGEPVYCRNLNVHGAMCVLLKDALLPNLVQTLENTPCFIHGGPFANIAHGCNSIRATKAALKLADYVITEAGFGADLGAEKFIDIKCRKTGLVPSVVVIVATVRALKYNGGVAKEMLKVEDLNALKKGIVNLEAHIDNIRKFGIEPVVTLNLFDADSSAELDYVRSFCKEHNVRFALSDVFAKGGDGGIELANEVCAAIDESNDKINYLYDVNDDIKSKIQTIVTKYYGGANVTYCKAALNAISRIEKQGRGNLPICIAKTQYSLSDDAKLLGRPIGFTTNVTNVTLSNGAGFIVVMLGDIMTMPGLPKKPAAEVIDYVDGKIVGLF